MSYSNLRTGVFDLDAAQVITCGASYAYLSEKFIYSWFMCRQAGYGLDLDPESPNFLLQLVQLISQMQE